MEGQRDGSIEYKGYTTGTLNLQCLPLISPKTSGELNLDNDDCNP